MTRGRTGRVELQTGVVTTGKWTGPAGRGMTTSGRTVRGEHLGGWGGETWRALEDAAGQKVGEMADHEPVQLAHVEGVAVVIPVADDEQCASRLRSAGLYRTPQRWSKMLTEAERSEVYHRVREGGGKLGVGPVVVE